MRDNSKPGKPTFNNSRDRRSREHTQSGLISFGYLHLPTGPAGRPVPPAADRVEDVRDRLRDPAAARDILDLDGLGPASWASS